MGRMLIAGKAPEKGADPIRPDDVARDSLEGRDNCTEDNIEEEPIEEENDEKQKVEEAQAGNSIQTRTQVSNDLDPVLRALYSCEAPNPIKRCQKCKNCNDCKKVILPCEEKNQKMIEMLKKNIEYDENKSVFKVNYIYNSHLPQLPSYEEPCKRIQARMEEKLIKSGKEKVQKYNEQIDDFFQRKVLEWVPPEELKETENQTSFIPITFTEKVEGTTKIYIYIYVY